MMCKFFLISTGRTVWEEQDRLESAVGSPLTPRGVTDVCHLAQQLEDCRISAIYCGDSLSEEQSAQLVARVLGVKFKFIHGLHELDYGLWQGLTLDEIQRRQPRVLRQWLDEPGSVAPPGGEFLADAADRLWQAVRTVARRHKSQSVLLVLRPIMLCLLRSRLDPSQEFRLGLREKLPGSQTPLANERTCRYYTYELDPKHNGDEHDG